MKYMLLIYGAEDAWTEQEQEDCMLESMAICDDLEAQGKYVAASPLHPVSTATSLRLRDRRVEVTDGPFAETTEQLGGYFIIEVEDLDEAISIAKRLPPAKKGTVEIRPVFPLPERDKVGDKSANRTEDTPN
ncbi:MAG: YciI family protein [Verrucomicrobiota bacterium JB023]|nr:YciI family protein [Verrucomicrobiota bacterium JB023]